MSAFVSKLTALVHNAVRSVSQLVRTSPWAAAAATAMIVLLFLA